MSTDFSFCFGALSTWKAFDILEEKPTADTEFSGVARLD